MNNGIDIIAANKFFISYKISGAYENRTRFL